MSEDARIGLDIVGDEIIFFSQAAEMEQEPRKDRIPGGRANALHG